MPIENAVTELGSAQSGPPPAPTSRSPVGAPDSASRMLQAALGVQALLTLGWIYLLRGSSLETILTVGALGAILWVLAYVLTYARSRTSDFPKAVGPTLVFAFLGIFLGFLVGGLLYLVAYSRLTRAVTASVSASQTRTPVYETADPPAPPRRCAYCGADFPSSFVTCPQCGAPA